MKEKNLDHQIVIYQAKSGALELCRDVRRQTILATQAEIARLYGKDQSVISRHIKKIFAEGEVDRKRPLIFLIPERFPCEERGGKRGQQAEERAPKDAARLAKLRNEILGASEDGNKAQGSLSQTPGRLDSDEQNGDNPAP